MLKGNRMDNSIAVIIPSYKVKRHIIKVIESIPDEVYRIFVIDDACPEGSGEHVASIVSDNRVRIICHNENKGVGGAVMTGYRAAVDDGAEVIVKIDGDGQMDASLIPYFVEPIIMGEADYTKGNRFFNLEQIRAMPRIRLVGNAVLSLMAKLSTGYWDIFDPTNGFTAIHADVARYLPYGKISQRFFFETDILFRLNTLRAVVVDVPMDAKYGDEASNLRISKVICEFFIKHFRNFFKRIFYNYYLRDMSLASLELPLGLLLVFFGLGFGSYQWLKSIRIGTLTTAGTVMIAALSILMGLQLVMAFLGYDIAAVPKRPRHLKSHKVFLGAGCRSSQEANNKNRISK
jgi:dolichol-phosphate mannosyltransferase